ncbi:MAG: DNA polymerase-3 subunit beta [Alphaproteobacteria bacterium]|jgi:DNA polymerase-3 subunit beta
MQLNIQKSILFKALNHIQGVVEKRNTIPILSNVLLTATNNRLSLTATDLDIEIVETVEAEITQEGAITVPAHILYEIVRKLPDSTVIFLNLDTENDRINVKANKSDFTLPCLPRDDFPLMTTSDAGTDFTISTADLKLILDKNKMAIAQEDTRYYLGGIYFHYLPEEDTASGVGQICGVATDGHRLSKVALIAPKNCATMPDVIIPRKTVHELRKLLDDVHNDVEINVTDTKIRFFTNTIQLTSKLIDGNFPKYQSAIPAHNNILITVNTKEFINAIDRVATVSIDKVKIVKLTISTGKIILSVESAELGSAIEEIDVEYEGAEINIGFNARYMLDILGQIDTAHTFIKLGENDNPLVITDDDSDMALFVLMPMRV